MLRCPNRSAALDQYYYHLPCHQPSGIKMAGILGDARADTGSPLTRLFTSNDVLVNSSWHFVRKKCQIFHLKWCGGRWRCTFGEYRICCCQKMGLVQDLQSRIFFLIFTRNCTVMQTMLEIVKHDTILRGTICICVLHSKFGTGLIPVPVIYAHTAACWCDKAMQCQSMVSMLSAWLVVVAEVEAQQQVVKVWLITSRSQLLNNCNIHTLHSQSYMEAKSLSHTHTPV